MLDQNKEKIESGSVIRLAQPCVFYLTDKNITKIIIETCDNLVVISDPKKYYDKFFLTCLLEGRVVNGTVDENKVAKVNK